MTDNLMRFDNPQGAQFSVEPETRTIRGVAVPFGVVGNNGAGKFRFTKGSLSWGKVKLLANHSWNDVLGVAELEETDEGVMLTARVARGAKGDEFLALAEMGAVDGLSIGLGADAEFKRGRDGVQDAVRGTIRETSLTAIPAFETASITSVAASAAQNKENEMDENETVEVETPVSLSADEVRTIFSEEIAKAIKPTGDLIPVQPAGRPDGAAQFQVREEAMYRFDGAIPGKHDFAADVIGAVNGDAAASARVMQFMGEQLMTPQGLQFVDTSDTAAVNPSRYRPDMFLDEGPAQPTPLYSFFYKGGLSDVTPFFYSKMGDYSDLLDDHTEGTEPTPGSFATESGATVTPSPISGKIHVTREVSDQGGNPQVSGLVWSKFQPVLPPMLETKTFGILNAGQAGYADFATITAGATGEVAGAAIEDGVVDLQFLADGSRFRKAFGHVDLYKVLKSAKDGMDRPLYPIINPSNADGSAGSLYGHINVAGLNIDPTWSLGATTVNQRSYVADPNAVHVWNSGLTKLEKLGEDVEGYDIGAWAYFAGIVYDASGIRKVTYATE